MVAWENRIGFEVGLLARGKVLHRRERCCLASVLANLSGLQVTSIAFVIIQALLSILMKHCNERGTIFQILQWHLKTLLFRKIFINQFDVDTIEMLDFSAILYL